MASLSIEQQREAIKLYKSGLSAQRVADALGTSIGAIYYPLRRYNIPRRTTQASNLLTFEAKPLSYRIKTELSPSEQKLKLAAVMLYWAEGYKLGTGVDFANSDPIMALLFTKFLKEICNVDKKRLRYHLYCYEGQDVITLTHFWSDLLSIPENQFLKPYVKKNAAPGPRGPRMIHGLIHVCYSDKRLLAQILSWISEYSQTCVGGRVVNCTRL